MYDQLHNEYEILSKCYPGWTLTEIAGMSPRERHNWMVRALRR